MNLGIHSLPPLFSTHSGSGTSHPSRGVLHVEDSDIDHEALKRSFRRMEVQNPLYWCRSAKQAHEYLLRPNGLNEEPSERKTLPSIVLLDLNLPGEDGRSFLKKLRGTPEFYLLPIVILSSSSDPKDVDYCYALGVNAYLVKPLHARDLDPLVLSFAHFWLKHSLLPSFPALGGLESTKLTEMTNYIKFTKGIKEGDEK